jgi:hypothetical protein
VVVHRNLGLIHSTALVVQLGVGAQRRGRRNEDVIRKKNVIRNKEVILDKEVRRKEELMLNHEQEESIHVSHLVCNEELIFNDTPTSVVSWQDNLLAFFGKHLLVVALLRHSDTAALLLLTGLF